MKILVTLCTALFVLVLLSSPQIFSATVAGGMAGEILEMGKEMGRRCYGHGQIRERMRVELAGLSKARLLDRNAYNRAAELEAQIAKADHVCVANLQ